MLPVLRDTALREVYAVICQRTFALPPLQPPVASVHDWLEPQWNLNTHPGPAGPHQIGLS